MTTAFYLHGDVKPELELNRAQALWFLRMAIGRASKRHRRRVFSLPHGLQLSVELHAG